VLAGNRIVVRLAGNPIRSTCAASRRCAGRERQAPGAVRDAADAFIVATRATGALCNAAGVAVKTRPRTTAVF
jgi:hypothetical protein